MFRSLVQMEGVLRFYEEAGQPMLRVAANIKSDLVVQIRPLDVNHPLTGLVDAVTTVLEEVEALTKRASLRLVAPGNA